MPAFLLQRAGQHLLHLARVALEAEGMTPRYFYVLAALNEYPGLSQQQVSTLVGVDPTGMVALLDEMEANGHVQRERNPRDRRRHILTVTANGMEAYHRQVEAMAAIERDFFTPLTADQFAAFNQALSQISQQALPAELTCLD
jgi:DNA-binding MarR family transcriptional regulator